MLIAGFQINTERAILCIITRNQGNSLYGTYAEKGQRPGYKAHCIGPSAT